MNSIEATLNAIIADSEWLSKDKTLLLAYIRELQMAQKILKHRNDTLTKRTKAIEKQLAAIDRKRDAAEQTILRLKTQIKRVSEKGK